MTHTATDTVIRSKLVVRWKPQPRTCKCPQCGSYSTTTKSTRPGHRYHACNACKVTFQSVE
jgi:transposase-like protein